MPKIRSIGAVVKQLKRHEQTHRHTDTHTHRQTHCNFIYIDIYMRLVEQKVHQATFYQN